MTNIRHPFRMPRYHPSRRARKTPPKRLALVGPVVWLGDSARLGHDRCRAKVYELVDGITVVSDTDFDVASVNIRQESHSMAALKAKLASIGFTHMKRTITGTNRGDVMEEPL